MFTTRALRQATAHAAERTPLIRFIGKREIPCKHFHTPYSVHLSFRHVSFVHLPLNLALFIASSY